MSERNYQGVGIYEHYKGGRYNVMGLATQTETGEVFVVYATFGDKDPRKHWVRPYEMFNEQVEGKPRFRKVGF